MDATLYDLKVCFVGKPACERCMLSFAKMGLGGETKMHCAALGNRPRCAEAGMRDDCPLRLVKTWEDVKTECESIVISESQVGAAKK